MYCKWDNYSKRTFKGITPYIGIKMASFDLMKYRFLPSKNDPKFDVINLTLGAIAGTIAVTATYPTDLIRRLLQLSVIKCFFLIYYFRANQATPFIMAWLMPLPKCTKRKAIVDGSRALFPAIWRSPLWLPSYLWLMNVLRSGLEFDFSNSLYKHIVTGTFD